MAKVGEKNWPKRPKFDNTAKIAKVGKNGQNWLKMAKINQHGQNWPLLKKLANMAKIGSKFSTRKQYIPMEQIQLLVICAGHSA